MRDWLAENLLYTVSFLSVLVALILTGVVGTPYWFAAFGMIMCYTAGHKRAESQFNVKLLNLAKEKKTLHD